MHIAHLIRPPLLVLLAALSATADADANVQVTDAWVRQNAPGTDTAALYLTLHNVGTTSVDLIGVETPAARTAMIHETRENGGVSRMRMVEHLAIAPGQSLEFKPGALHIMLDGLAHPLAVGERVALTLRFAHGPMHVTAVVRPLGN